MKSSKPVQIPIEQLADHVGRLIGRSDWYPVTQEAVTAFADLTSDDQWIHTDAERAASGPFGGTIAHGYLTLALASALSDEVMAVGNSAMAVNYGLERVRFPAPLRVGARVRAAVEIVAAEPIPNGIHLVRKLTFEANDAPKPVCVAVTVARYFV